MRSATSFGLNQINLIKKKAHQLQKNYETLYQIKLSPQKKQTLNLLAKYKTKQIEWTIQKNQYQKRLNRTIDKIDTERRQKYQQQLKRKEQIAKIQANLLRQKRSRLREKFNKHFDEVGNRFAESCQTVRNKSRQLCSSLQKDKQQFLQNKQKQLYRRTIINTNKPKCFDLAQNYIEKRDSKSRQFSQNSLSRLSDKQQQSTKRLNSERQNKMKQIKKSQKSNVQVLKKKQLQRQEKQQNFLQMYAKDVETTKKCHLLKTFTTEKRVKKIQENLKKKYEIWENNKKIIDDRHSEIPDRCNSIMQTTLTAKFKSPPSPIRQNSKLWQKNAIRKKQQLKQDCKLEGDLVIQKHQENTNSFKTAKKLHIQMQSLRHRAAVLSLKYC